MSLENLMIVLWPCDKCGQPRHHMAYKLPAATYLFCPYCGTGDLQPNAKREDETWEQFIERREKEAAIDSEGDGTYTKSEKGDLK